MQVQLAARGGGRPARPLAAVHALAVEDVDVRYGKVYAVRALSFDVPAGSVVGLIGPNGCGKTSTLRVAAGLLRPATGRVSVCGLPQGTRAARSRAAYVPDEPDGLDELCSAEYLALVKAVYGAGGTYDVRVPPLLRAFALESQSRVRLAALSHGQRRMLAIVAALALDRALLLVDEATAALDPESTAVLREALRHVAGRGTGVLIGTQDLAFAEKVCDRVVLLSRGRAIASGPTSDLAGAQSLEDAYLEAVGAQSRLREVRRGLDAV